MVKGTEIAKREITHLLVLALLACMITAGCERNESPSANVESLTRSAENGDARGQNNLGAMYANGEGVEVDYVEAVKWFRKAAEQGFAAAQFSLGVMYHTGEGVERDNIEAYKWALRAGWNGEDVDKFKNILQSILTPEQISKAQELAKEFVGQ